MTINIVSIIFFIIAGASLLVAIYSFIRFNIPQVIGELSGRTAKKSIAQMRDKNLKTGDKSHRPTKAAQKRGTLTDKIEEKQIKQSDATELLDEGTELLDNSTELLSEEGTELLGNETEVLNNATELLNDNATELLDEGTALLTQAVNTNQNTQNVDGFKMIQNIVLIHTNEII